MFFFPPHPVARLKICVTLELGALAFTTSHAQNSPLSEWITLFFRSHFLRSCVVPILPSCRPDGCHLLPHRRNRHHIIIIVRILDRFRTLPCSDMLHCHYAVTSHPCRLAVNCAGETHFSVETESYNENRGTKFSLSWPLLVNSSSSYRMTNCCDVCCTLPLL